VLCPPVSVGVILMTPVFRMLPESVNEFEFLLKFVRCNA
jgi:hypothetical protein